MFTDEDLKKLKVRANNPLEGLYPYRISIKSPELNALIARLEAAERSVRSCRIACLKMPPCQHEKDLEAWRTAAGK